MRKLLVNILTEKNGKPQTIFQNVQRDSLENIIFSQNNHPKFNNTDIQQPPKGAKAKDKSY